MKCVPAITCMVAKVCRDGADVAARMPLLACLGDVGAASTYWYLQATPELLAVAAQWLEQLKGQRSRPRWHPLSRRSSPSGRRFSDASPHTVAAFRDTLRLLLVFAHNRTGKPPSRLDVGDIDATLVAAFLTHVETERGNSVSTRSPAHRHRLAIPLRRPAAS